MNKNQKTLIASIALLGMIGVTGVAKNANADSTNQTHSASNTPASMSSSAVHQSSQATSASSSTNLKSFASSHAQDSNASKIVKNTKRIKKQMLNGTYKPRKSHKKIAKVASVKNEKEEAYYTDTNQGVQPAGVSGASEQRRSSYYNPFGLPQSAFHANPVPNPREVRITDDDTAAQPVGNRPTGWFTYKLPGSNREYIASTDSPLGKELDGQNNNVKTSNDSRNDSEETQNGNTLGSSNNNKLAQTSEAKSNGLIMSIILAIIGIITMALSKIKRIILRPFSN